jgi:hypothetical protein
MGRSPLAKWLRKASFAEIFARYDPNDSECEGALYEMQTPTITEEFEKDRLRFIARLSPEAQRQWMFRARLLDEGKLRMVSGGPLSSESVAPFVLDGRECRSVWAFYQSLKLPEGDPGRAAAARGEHGRIGRKGASFRYRGEEIAVNSVAHGVLVARATEAKVLAHEHVQQALAATGMCRLYIGTSSSQALGRYMPFALMVMRLRVT